MVKINELSIEEKIGQMIMVGIEGKTITKRIKKLIEHYHIGGIILYRKNFNTYEELLNLIRELKKLNCKNHLPLFIAIDQEGGRVNRMPKEFENILSAKTIAEKKNIKYIQEAADITGEMLFKTGFNMNFSPVLDIKRFDNNHAIGDRCYGENKEDVIKYGIPVMKKLQNKKIISVIKHFPGHGATKKDSHYLLPVINKLKDLEDNDIKPFEEAIKQGADAIMVGHLLINKIGKVYPASLSRKFIYQYLRKRYKYNGLVITDDLKMRAIRFLFGESLSTKKAFEAGNDIVIFRYNQKQEEKVIKQILDAAKCGKLKINRINKSVSRIIKIKEKYEISDEKEIVGCNIEEINKRIFDLNNAN